MCQGKTPCPVFANTEDLTDSPSKQSVQKKSNTKEIEDRVKTNEEEKNIDEAEPVRLTIPDDIGKEADRQHMKQNNKNTQISDREQQTKQIYCASTILNQHAVFIHGIEQ
eukprot:8106498-Ditylum_brightwellii.AAC.1